MIGTPAENSPTSSPSPAAAVRGFREDGIGLSPGHGIDESPAFSWPSPELLLKNLKAAAVVLVDVVVVAAAAGGGAGL